MASTSREVCSIPRRPGSLRQSRCRPFRSSTGICKKSWSLEKILMSPTLRQITPASSPSMISLLCIEAYRHRALWPTHVRPMQRLLQLFHCKSSSLDKIQCANMVGLMSPIGLKTCAAGSSSTPFLLLITNSCFRRLWSTWLSLVLPFLRSQQPA